MVLPCKVTPKTHNSQTENRKSTGDGEPPVTHQSSGGRDSVAHHWSSHDQQKEVDVRKKSTLVFVFFCLFLHFIIKNKSVFVLYNTIQHPHRGSINHQSSTDKKKNFFLVVSLVFFFLFFFKLFSGFLKKKKQGWWWWGESTVEGFLTGNQDSGQQGIK